MRSCLCQARYIKNYQTIFQNGSCQQYLRVPVVLHPHQHLTLPVFQVLLFGSLISRCIGALQRNRAEPLVGERREGKRESVLRNCLMRLWELAHSKFVGHTVRLEIQARVNVAALNPKPGNRQHFYIVQSFFFF